jgi:hypothetical protein
MTRTYFPGPVQRLYQLNAAGESRPVGIPNIRDRVVHFALVLILSNIFEPDLVEDGLSGEKFTNAGCRKLNWFLERKSPSLDGDEETKFFDHIPFQGLTKVIRQRVSDGKITGLIKKFIEAPIVVIEEQ